MERSDAIRRAMRQTAQYELPSGFTPRLMKRVRERERRRETLETLAYLSGGVACFAALIAGCIYAWMQYMESTPREQMSPEMPYPRHKRGIRGTESDMAVHGGGIRHAVGVRHSAAPQIKRFEYGEIIYSASRSAASDTARRKACSCPSLVTNRCTLPRKSSRCASTPRETNLSANSSP